MELIIHEVCARDRDAQLRRKFTVIELRELNQDEQNQTSQAKVDQHRALYGVFFDGAAVIFQVGAAVAGQTPVGGLMGVAQQAFAKTGDYRRSISTGEIEVYTHRYQRINNIMQEESQQIHKLEQDSTQMHNKIDRTLASIQRIFELMASNSP